MHEEERVEMWRSLGYQPGVSAWFAVWLLSRLHLVPLRRPTSTARLRGGQYAG